MKPSQERQAARAPPVLRWPRLQRVPRREQTALGTGRTVLERSWALLPLSSRGREGVRDGVVSVKDRQAEHCPRVAALTPNPGWHPRPATGAPPLGLSEPGQEAQLEKNHLHKVSFSLIQLALSKWTCGEERGGRSCWSPAPASRQHPRGPRDGAGPQPLPGTVFRKPYG